MRIIAGLYKGRTIAGPTTAGVRPTSDSLRETLFNILGPSVQGARVLDGFAGTGALGLEALSRGAAHVTFIERDARVAKVLRENICRCGADASSHVVERGFPRPGEAAARETFDLILLDPPYDVEDLDAIVRAAAEAAPGGRVVLEHSRRREPPAGAGPLHRTRTVTAGDSALSFYQ
jgi:16S rRNA (guanine966-N2)-methyltransferase